MSTDNSRQSGQKQTHRRPRPKKIERVIIGASDVFATQRENLFANIEAGQGKVKPYGRHILFTVGSEQFGFVEYLILHATIPQHVLEDRGMTASGYIKEEKE